METGSARLCCALVAALALYASALAQNLTPEQGAEVFLNGARAAFNERNYPVAIERFRTAIQKFPNKAHITAARYGLGLALMEAPEKDYTAAAEALSAVAGVADFPDRPYACYYLGLAHEGLGNRIIEQAAAKPNEAQQLRAQAAQRFNIAATSFAAAADLFAKRIPTTLPADVKQLPVDLEWANLARCRQAEMLLRLGRAKEAQDLTRPLLSDPVLSKTGYSKQAAYLHGHACFLMRDYVSAAKSLVMLAPFEDSDTGLHARYLLARTHHLNGDRPEAAALYEAIQAGYPKLRKAAEDALKNPDALKDKPLEKARFQAIVSQPAPDYVARAGFYWGILLYEQGKFADALTKFQQFVQQNPKSPLTQEAQLRQGFSHVQLKQYGEAIASLQPLQDHPQLADQALRWLAKAQIGSANPGNPQQYDQAVAGGIANLRKAADKLKAILADPKALAADPDAKNRRTEVMMDLGDAQQLLRQYKEAAGTYQLIIGEAAAPDVAEQALHGQATALQLGGMYKESDEACQKFQSLYPKSPLLPAVAFRFAENPYLSATIAATNPKSGVPPEQIKQLYTEAVKRYQQVIQKFPAFPHLSLARQGLASASYQLGDYDGAAKALASIPEADRTGPLVAVNYMLADCLLRTLPPEGDDALATARLLQQLEAASNLLTGVMMTENSPLVPDATIKLGYTLQRMAALTADPNERNATLLKARQGYARFMLPLRNHPLYPLAVLENAKVTELLGGFGAAVRELQQFQQEPLKRSPLATLAILRLAEGMRGQRRAAEAANILGQFRQQNEAELLKNPDRDDWVPGLQFGHAMALKDAGKFSEARPIFENLIKQFPNRPEAIEAPLRLAQCIREESGARIDAAGKVLTTPASTPEQRQAAKSGIESALKELRQTCDVFLAQAKALEGKPGSEALQLRAIYEAAWCQRSIGDVEVDNASEAIAAEMLKKLQEKVSKQSPTSRPALPTRAPEVRVTQVPLQPGEIKARELYQKVITLGGDAPLAMDASFELAELYAIREEHDKAVPVLASALQMETLTPDLAERMRLRLGACYLAKGDAKAAAAQFETILKAPRSPLLAPARYGAGEAAMLQQNWAGAVQLLLPFQDSEQYRHLPGTSDRAILRLGQAYAQLGQWENSRKAMESIVTRFPRSAWVHEARYGMGLALQNLKRYDEAIAAYTEVTLRTGAQVAAQAQVQIGLCRLEQKRPGDAANALLTVIYTYDYPDCGAMALCEAARAYVELKQPADARSCLERVVKDYPAGQWAQLAQKRLAEVK